MALDLARLRKLVYAGAKSRWGELKDFVVDRLEFELESIERFGRTAYMLMAAEVVEAIRNAGGQTGPGRGADVGSAVCYTLGISGIDPLEHDLLLERFMHSRQQADATLVLVDTDAAGEKAALSVLSKYGEVKPELRRKYYAPQDDILCAEKAKVYHEQSHSHRIRMERVRGRCGGCAQGT